jgi:protein TonB
MKRSATLLSFPVILGLAFARTQSSAAPLQSGIPNSSSEAPADHAVNAREGVIPPRETYAPEPKYRNKALKGHKNPVVVFRLVVGKDGLPNDITVVRSVSPELDEAGLNTVRQWRFAPATKDGKPISVKVNIEIHFKP